MRTNRQELWRTVSRRVRHGQKISGRIVASLLGFGIAYYFDTENGGLRRERLLQRARRVLRTLDGTYLPEVADPPPVFPTVLRTHRAAEATRHADGPATAVR